MKPFVENSDPHAEVNSHDLWSGPWCDNHWCIELFKCECTLCIFLWTPVIWTLTCWSLARICSWWLNSQNRVISVGSLITHIFAWLRRVHTHTISVPCQQVLGEWTARSTRVVGTFISFAGLPGNLFGRFIGIRTWLIHFGAFVPLQNMAFLAFWLLHGQFWSEILQTYGF